MSLDMTVGAREAALDSTDDEIETHAAAVTPVWLAGLTTAAAAGAWRHGVFRARGAAVPALTNQIIR